MPELPYMPLCVGDYLSDTQGLTTEQHGAYFLLILHYWSTGQAIEDDDETLASITRLSNERWNVRSTGVRTKLQRFFQIKDGYWFHNRIERELEKARKLVQQRIDAGILSGKSRAKTNERSTSVDTSVPTGRQRAYERSNSDSNSSSSSLKQETLLEQETLLQPPKQSRLDQEFEEDYSKFWVKLGGRKDIRKAYEQARKEAPRETIMAAVVKQGPILLAKAERGGVTVVYPASWLRDGRWTDEISEIAPTNGHGPPRRQSEADIKRETYVADLKRRMGQ